MSIINSEVKIALKKIDFETCQVDSQLLNQNTKGV